MLLNNDVARTAASQPAPHVSVVIPFFQRQPGLLLAAVRSALSQSAAAIRIIVVDDGSPIQAKVELATLASHERDHVEIIMQHNAGPGAARNRALAAVPETADYIAFLDSDDSWTPGHLARALTAFTSGADFYFTDYAPLHAATSAFALCGLRADDPAHRPEGDGLHTYGGDLFDALLHRSPVGTPTVVVRRELAAGLAFPTGFSFAEDVFFWMRLTRRARKIMFSTIPGVLCGAGVNISAAAAWGTPSSLRKLGGEYRFHRAVVSAFPLSPAQRAWSRAWRREVAWSFVTSLLHLLRRGGPVDWRSVGALMADCTMELPALLPPAWPQSRSPARMSVQS